FIENHKIPYVVLHVPHNFRSLPPGYRQISHGELHKNWRAWERDKYWERHGGREWHGEERREHDRPGPDKGSGKGRHGD
ncbi:MAG: hypothetical protein MUP41_07090, partial [Desulfobacterales bacterium]|nr:hypothetical protein [Desulfobacterales bacterium]